MGIYLIAIALFLIAIELNRISEVIKNCVTADTANNYEVKKEG